MGNNSIDEYMKEWIYLYLIIVNLFSFLLFGFDKFKSVRKLWRIPERSLILSAVAGGSIGALAGMWLWNHKKRVAKFKYGIPLVITIQIIIYLLISRYF